MTNEGKKDFLTPGEAAKELGMGRTNLYRLIHSGEIAARKIGGSWRISRNTMDILGGEGYELERAIQIFLVEDGEPIAQSLRDHFCSWSILNSLVGSRPSNPYSVEVHSLAKRTEDGWLVRDFEREALDVFAKYHNVFDAVLLNPIWRVDTAESYLDRKNLDQEVAKVLFTARWWPLLGEAEHEPHLLVVDAGRVLAHQFRKLDEDVPIFMISDLPQYFRLPIVCRNKKLGQWRDDKKVLEEICEVQNQLMACAQENNYTVIDKPCRSQLLDSQVERILNAAISFKNSKQSLSK